MTPLLRRSNVGRGVIDRGAPGAEHRLEALADGDDIRTVRELLGHKDVRTTISGTRTFRPDRLPRVCSRPQEAASREVLR